MDYAAIHMFRRLRELLVQPVPDSLAVCEFDCPVTHCTTKTWSSCILRKPDPHYQNRPVRLTAGNPGEAGSQDVLQVVQYKVRLNR
jgi:hypothetical protein